MSYEIKLEDVVRITRVLTDARVSVQIDVDRANHPELKAMLTSRVRDVDEALGRLSEITNNHKGEKTMETIDDMRLQAAGGDPAVSAQWEAEWGADKKRFLTSSQLDTEILSKFSKEELISRFQEHAFYDHFVMECDRHDLFELRTIWAKALVDAANVNIGKYAEPMAFGQATLFCDETHNRYEIRRPVSAPEADFQAAYAAMTDYMDDDAGKLVHIGDTTTDGVVVSTYKRGGPREYVLDVRYDDGSFEYLHDTKVPAGQSVEDWAAEVLAEELSSGAPPIARVDGFMVLAD